MNLKIYKWVTHYYDNNNVICYVVKDLDLPEDKPCIMISQDKESWALYTQMFPRYLQNVEESSFLDLLIVTGITQSQIEYIFINIDFDKHTISIQPRDSIVALGITMTGSTSSQVWSTPRINNTGNVGPTITLGSSFSHAKSINI